MQKASPLQRKRMGPLGVLCVTFASFALTLLLFNPT